MKSYKSLMNELSDDKMLRQLNDDEVHKLRDILLKAYVDLDRCCEKNNIEVMLIGGSVLGAIRHEGFIPWDDDLDLAMTRDDFDVLKRVFDSELGDRYILSSPNYLGNASDRYPKMLVKDTLCIEAGMSPNNVNAKIKVDIFLIDNVPDGIIHRYAKGIWCSFLMLATSYVYSYENDTDSFKRYMCKTNKGKREYMKRRIVGKMLSFLSFQKWANLTDYSFQYHKNTKNMSIPSGRKHYFGEIRPAKTFLPISRGMFEGIEVNLPGDPVDYLKNLYGTDYMILPPEDKRERHFILDIDFDLKSSD